MGLPENLPQQVQLALAVLSGRIAALTPLQRDLFQIESDSEDIRLAAEQILFEVIMASLPHEEPTIDLREVAVDLLNRIAENGGVLHRDRVGVPDEVIAQLEKEGVVKKMINGLAWGPNARRAIQQFNEEKNP